MPQEINLVLKIIGTQFLHSTIVSKKDLHQLNINKSEQCIKGIDNSILHSKCSSCRQQLTLNVYWYEDPNLVVKTEPEVINEPLVQIKEEPELDVTDGETNNEPEMDFDDDDDVPKSEINKFVYDKMSMEYVLYPGMTYLLPIGLKLPSFDRIQVPYFEILKQDNGTVIYAEKKRKKKCPVRVTNYDPRRTQCDICGYKVPNTKRLSAHRKGHMFLKFTDEICRGCGIFCGDNANDKLNHTFFCIGKDKINGLACPSCSYEGKDYRKLRSHLQKKHTGFNPIPKPNRANEVECDLCGTKVLDENALNLHQNSKCPLFEKHKERQKAQIDKYLKNLDLPSNIILPDIESIKDKHSQLYPQADGTNIFISKSSNYLEIMNFDPRRDKCDLCGKAHLFKKAEVVEHRLTRHFFPKDTDTICPGCGKECRSLEQKTVHSHFCTKKYSIRVNYCRECDMQHPNYSKYAKHLRRCHSGEGLDKKFICHFCSATYDTIREFRTHVIRHTDPRPFKCAHCKEDFKGKTGLEAHLIRSHFPHETKISCKVCNPPQFFSDSKAYKSHMNIVHSNTREREPCPVCGIQILKSGMETHVRRQHTEHNLKKKFECLTCGKLFVSTINLKIHERTHLPEHQRQFKCRFCERRFNISRVCVEHERSHTGEKPYKCDICDKAYARNQALKDHQREHTGEGYKCSVCYRTFTDRGNFRHHMKQHESQLGVKLTLNHEDRRLVRLKVITEEQALRGEGSLNG